MDENNDTNQQEVNINVNNTEGVVSKELNVCALLSLIFSLVGLFAFGFPLGVAAIVLGIIGIVKFKPEKQKFKWMAIAGLCVGIFDILGVILGVILSVTALTALF